MRGSESGGQHTLLAHDTRAHTNLCIPDADHSAEGPRLALLLDLLLLLLLLFYDSWPQSAITMRFEVRPLPLP